MTRRSSGSANPLATMLILSAIDVLLCSFTAGIALFLMGDTGAAQAKRAEGGGSPSKDYLYVDALGVYRGAPGFFIRGGPFGFGGAYRVYWANASVRPAAGLLKIQPHSEAGCKAKDDGEARWIIECDARDKSDWFADLVAAEALSLRITSIVGADSRFCLANVQPGSNVRVYGERPEFRLTLSGASAAKDVEPDGEVMFDCRSGR